MPQTDDKVLDSIIKEVAEELGIKVEVIWRVYNHFYFFIFKLITESDLKSYNTETKRKLAHNIILPGIGRLLNKYGKVYRPKGVKEKQFKK